MMNTQAFAKLKILLIEDDPSFQLKVKNALSTVGKVISVPTLKAARDLIHQEAFDICLLDYQLPDGLGIELLSELKRHPAHGPIIFLSGNSDPLLIQRCLNLGAADFIQKTSQYETDLLTRIPLAISRSKTLHRYLELEEKSRKSFRYEIIGESAPIKTLKKTVATIAGESIHSILIEGPPGSGKELVARKLNQLESHLRPLVLVNCSSITESNFDLEFFGHVNSSFSQVQPGHSGYVSLAKNGDLFLEEIADLPPSCQDKLSRFLIQQEYVPVGGQVPVPVRIRILSTTTHPLETLVQTGEFNRNLYYAISDHVIRVPGLSDRPNDIPVLIQYFLSTFSSTEYSISPIALEQLKQYDWPGNVRELEQVLRSAYLKAKMRESKTIDVLDLERVCNSNPIQTALPHSLSEVSKESYNRFMSVADRLYWENALKLFGHNASKLSRESGVSLSTINKKIKDLKLRSVSLLLLLSFCVGGGGDSLASGPIEIPVAYFEPLKHGGSFLTQKSSSELLRGIQIAEQVFNAEARACNTQAKITPYLFNQDDYVNLLRTSKELMEGQKAWFIIGPRQSEQYLGLVKMTPDVPSISPLASIDKVFSLGSLHLTMAVRHSELAQQLVIESVAQASLLNRPPNYVTLLRKGCLFCKEFAENFHRQAKKQQLTQLESFSLESDTPQVEDIKKFIEQVKPTYLLLPNNWDVTFYLIQQLSPLSHKVIFLGGDGWGDQFFGALPLLTPSERRTGVNAISVRAYSNAHQQLKNSRACQAHPLCRKHPPDHSAAAAYIRTMEGLARMVCRFKPTHYEEFRKIYRSHAKEFLPIRKTISVNYLINGRKWKSREVPLSK